MFSAARRLGICLSLFAAPALAADADGRFVVEGAGRISCARFLQEQDQTSSVFYAAFGWIDGYATAFNTLRDDTFDITPWETTELLLLKLSVHCKAHPDVSLGDSVAALMRSLDDKRLRAFSPPSQARKGDTVVVLYAEMFRRIAEALVAQGYLAEGERTEFDTPMGLALLQFQNDKGLVASGLPDQPTLNALLR